MTAWAIDYCVINRKWTGRASNGVEVWISSFSSLFIYIWIRMSCEKSNVCTLVKNWIGAHSGVILVFIPPHCSATREINTKITFSVRHSSSYITLNLFGRMVVCVTEGVITTIMILIMTVVTIIEIFKAINYLLIHTLGFLYISISGSANAQLPGCFRPWTFSLNIGLNIFPLHSFMSCLHYLLGYSTVEFQVLHLIVLVAFGAVD